MVVHGSQVLTSSSLGPRLVSLGPGCLPSTSNSDEEDARAGASDGRALPVDGA